MSWVGIFKLFRGWLLVMRLDCQALRFSRRSSFFWLLICVEFMFDCLQPTGRQANQHFPPIPWPPWRLLIPIQIPQREVGWHPILLCKTKSAGKTGQNGPKSIFKELKQNHNQSSKHSQPYTRNFRNSFLIAPAHEAIRLAGQSVVKFMEAVSSEIGVLGPGKRLLTDLPPPAQRRWSGQTEPIIVYMFLRQQS